MAASLGNRETYNAEDLVNSAVAACDAVVGLGGAERGDKTVLDALYPFVETLEKQVSQGKTVVDALRAAAEAATLGAAWTSPLRPRKGRARPLADRSVGTPDPGAVSFALIATAIADEASQPGRGPGATGLR